jgi:hypothetical protein
VLIWVPPPGKKGTTKDMISMIPAATRIQKLRLFMRGKAMSGAPIMSGIIQFAMPAAAGITAPNIISKA